MPRLIIIADIHGFYPAWQEVTAILRPDDTLAVAGDFFDTRYGPKTDTDYQPELIKREFKQLTIPRYYVYGNCDKPSFLPGYDYVERFIFEGKNILLTHGHFIPPGNQACDIKIEGHTHSALIQEAEGTILLNPGSIPLPRNGFRGYAVIENQEIRLVAIPLPGIH